MATASECGSSAFSASQASSPRRSLARSSGLPAKMLVMIERAMANL
jgi:hypothetical protein